MSVTRAPGTPGLLASPIPVECGDKMHLRRARVGKAHLDPAADQRAHQAFGAVHLVSPLGFFSVLQVSCMLIRLSSIDTTYWERQLGDIGGARAAAGSSAWAGQAPHG